MSFSQGKYSASDAFEKLGWLEDKWIFTQGENITYENWTRLNDTIYSGESHTVRNGDTVFTEQLKIEKTGEDIFYTAVVAHNPGPVSFKLKDMEEHRAVFENPEHDFPSRIIYELKNNGSLYARIEGKNKKGEEIIGEFFYNRAR